jgi:predicted site-specific integrase-resolvase
VSASQSKERQTAKSARRVTPKELATHLSIHPTQVLIMTKKGIIPTVVNEGRIYRYDLEEVDRVLAERAEEKRRQRLSVL